jgi:hypothetical protein
MRILIIGSGHRVQEAIIPVILNRKDKFDLVGIYSRTAKTLDALGVALKVETLDQLSQNVLSETDLIYSAVETLATPTIIAKLMEFNISQIDLLLDTPGLHVKHIGMVNQLRKFRHCWVAEDIPMLPWLDTITKAQDHHKLGDIKSITLDRCGWEYHGVALCKTLLSNRKLISSRKSKSKIPSHNNDDEFEEITL